MAMIDQQPSVNPLRIGEHGVRRTAKFGEPRRRLSRRQGAAAVEFAIVLPLFITMVLGCIDFGRFGHSYIAVSNAARAGAGRGMMNRVTTATQGTWVTAVTQSVRDEMQHVVDSDGAAAGDLQVTASFTVEDVGLWRVRVDVQYPFRTIVSWPLIPQQIDLQRTVVMRGIR